MNSKTNKEESAELLAQLECLLFVSGEPIQIEELCRLFNITMLEMTGLIRQLEARYSADKRGIIAHVTDESMQLVSNKKYSGIIEDFMQPVQTRSFSQSMLEALTIIAYRQPITRAEIDAIRGVRSEYTISQLLKQGFVCERGRKDVVGRPQLLGTTDKFLRKFGLHTLSELPEYTMLSDPNKCIIEMDTDEIDDPPLETVDVV